MKLMILFSTMLFSLSFAAFSSIQSGQHLYDLGATGKIRHIVGSRNAPLVMMEVTGVPNYFGPIRLIVMNVKTGKVLHEEELERPLSDMRNAGDFVEITVGSQSSLLSFTGQRYEFKGTENWSAETKIVTNSERNEIAIYKLFSCHDNEPLCGYDIITLDATSFAEKSSKQFRHPLFTYESAFVGGDRVIFQSKGKKPQLFTVDIHRNEVVHTLTANSRDTIRYTPVSEQIALREVNNKEGLFFSFINLDTGVEAELRQFRAQPRERVTYGFLGSSVVGEHIMLTNFRSDDNPWHMQVFNLADLTPLYTLPSKTLVYFNTDLDRKCMVLNEDFSQYECRQISDDSLVFNILTQPNDGAFAHFLDYDGLKDMMMDAKVISEGVVEYSFFDIYDGNMVRQFTVKDNNFTLTFAGSEQQFVVSKTGQELRSWKL